jgi:hypothetical protein
MPTTDPESRRRTDDQRENFLADYELKIEYLKRSVVVADAPLTETTRD